MNQVGEVNNFIARTHTHAKRVRAHARRKEIMEEIRISLYKNENETTEYKPDKEWTQVTTNPTSIASLLITIDNLEKGQAIVITKER